MNKIYKVIFNRNKNRYEIVSELASSRGGKCKVKAGKQIAKLFMTGLLATSLSSVASAADEEVKVKYDAATGTIKIVKADESQVLASYAVGGNISPITSIGDKNPTGIIAIGDQSKAVQSNSIAIGANTHAGDGLTPAKGKNYPEDNSTGYIAIGTKAVASGKRSISLGNESSTNKGSYNIAQGNDSISIGSSTSVFGYSGVSIGRRNIIGVPAPNSIDDTTKKLTTKSNTPYKEADPGGNSVIVGAYNVAYGNRSSIVGTYSRAMGSNSVAIGSGVQSLSDGSIAIGKGSGYEFEDGSRRKSRGEKEFYGRDWELPPEYKVLKQVLSTDIAGDEQYKGKTDFRWEKGGTLPKYNNYGAGSSDPGGFIVEGENALGIGTYTQVRGDSAIGLATGKMTADLSEKDKSDYAKDMGKIMDMEETLYLAKEELKSGSTSDKATLEANVKTAEESLAAAKKDFREKYLKKYSFVDGNGALGVGRQILAQGDRSMAVGDYAKAISSDAIAYGGQTLANGTNSMAMGGKAHVGTEETGFNNSMAIGSHTNVQAGNAVALGAFSQVTGTNSLALGFGTQSSTDSNNITYNSVSGHDSTLIGSYGNIAGNNSILIGSSGSIANDRVVGLGNNINIAAAKSDDQENNTAGSVFLGDHAGYVTDSKRARSLGKVDVVGSNEKMELTESLSSTKGALRDYTKDFIYIYMLEKQDDGTQIGAPIAVRSDFAGGDSTVGVVSVGSTYEQTFENLDKIKEHHKKVGSLITVPVEVTVQVMKNGISLGKQQQTRYFAADATQEQINSDSTLSDEDKKKVWDTIQESRKKADTKYTVFETRRIQNVAPGLIGSNSTDAINGSQLFATNQMLGNLVGSLKKTFGDNVTITEDGQINVSGGGTLGWIAKAKAADGGTVDYQVGKDDKITKDNLKEKGSAIEAADQLVFQAGKNIGLVQTPDTLTISTIDTPSFTSVTTGSGDNTTVMNQDGVTIKAKTGNTDGTKTDHKTSITKDGLATDGTVEVTNGKDGDQAKNLVTIGKNVDPNAPAGTDGENGTIGLDGKNGSSATITVDRGTSSLDDTKNIGGTDPKQDISENNPAKMDRITYTTKNKDDKDVITHEVATMDDGLFFSGDSADGKDGNVKNKFDRKLSQETKIVGGVNLGLTDNASAEDRTKAIADKLTDGNIGVISDGTDTLTVKLAKNLMGLDSTTYTSPTTKTDDGDATSTMKVDGNGVRFVGDNNTVKNDAPSLTTDGITGGNKTITDVASGIGGEVKDPDKNNANTFLENVNKIGKKDGDQPAADAISENVVVNAKDLKNLVDTGFKLNTSGQGTAGATTVKIGDTIKVVDGANTKVSAIDDSTTGTHTFHIDVNGLPMSYVDSDGNPLTKIGDKFYKTSDLVNGVPPAGTAEVPANKVTSNVSMLDNTGSHTGVAPQIKNVGSGLVDNNGKTIKPNELLNMTDANNPVLKNAVNVGDLKQVAAAAKTEVTGTGEAFVTDTEAEDGHIIYNVHVDKILSHKDAAGNELVRGGDGKYYTNEEIKDKTYIPSENKWYSNRDITDGKPNKDAQAVTPNPVDQSNVKTSLVNPNTGVGTGTDTSMTLDNVKSGIGGDAGNGIKDGTTVDGTQGNNTFIKNLDKVGGTGEGAIDKTTVVNAGDLKNLADTPLFFSGDAADGKEYNGTKNAKNTFGRKLSEEAKIVGGVTTPANLTDNNIGVVSNGTDTLTIKLAKELTNLTSVTTGSGDNTTVMNQDGVTIKAKTDHKTSLTKDGLATDGTIKVTGDNAKDLVTIAKGTDGSGTDKEYGKIGLEGKNGSNATLTVDRGTKSVTDSANVGKDPTKPIGEKNPVAGMDRLTYTTTGIGDNTIEHQVATLDDGFFLTTEHTKADETRTVLFNNTIKVLDGANTKVSAMGGENGTHTFSIDVTGLPMTYTATDANGKTQDVHKVGDTYTLADGTKLVQVGDKFYKPDQVEEVNGTPQVKADQEDKDTKLNNISLTSPVANTAPTLSNVGSALKKSDGTRITMSDLDDNSVYPTNNPIWNNAVNVGDLKAATDAARTEVTGTGKAIVTKKTGDQGQNIYNVHVDPIVDVVGADGSKVVRGDDGKYYNPTDIANKTYIPNADGNGGNWYDNGDLTNGVPNQGAKPQNVTPTDVKNNFVNPNGTDSIVLDNVKSGIGGEVKDAAGKNTFIDNINKVGKKNPDGTVAPDAISENTVVNAKDLKNVVDTGFKLNTSGHSGNAQTVKIGETIKVVDGANTKVSDITPKDGVHEFHIDVTGLPMTYTVSQTGGTDAPVSVSKVGDTYQLADGTKLVKVGDKFYKPSQLVDPKAEQPQVKPEEENKDWTVNDSISLVNKEGSNNAPTLKNVGSGLKDANGNSTTLDQAVGSNAVNVDDLRTLGKAATTEVTGTGAAEVTKVTGANGQNIYNVHVDKLMTVKPVDPKANITRGGDGKYYNKDDIAGKTFVSDGNGGGSWYNASDVDAKTGKPLEGKSALAKQPIALDQSKLKNSVVNPNGDGATIVDNVKSGIGGEVKDTSGKNTFIDNINKVGKKSDDGTAAPDAISENTVVNAKDLKNVVDTGFKLNTSGHNGDAQTVKIGETIKVVDGANTKVSDITSKDGVHEFHIDVTGLPMTYTVSQTGDAGTSESVSKVGDTYQLADGTKLVKVDNKFYKPSQLVDPNADQPQVRLEEVAKDWTVNDSISLVNKDGSNNAPTTLKNVGSGLKDANGNATTLDKAVGSNAVNVDDLRTLGKAATTEVTGTGAAEVTKVTGADGQNIYNVHVERFMQVAETDVEGNKVVKAADNHYYKEADIKDKTYIDGKWYNNTDIKDKTKIGDKWYSNTEITDGKANPDATELTVQATAPNKAVGLQNNLVNPNDNTPTRLSNLASALSGEVGNGANPADNSAINGIDKNGKPTSESGNNTFVKNVLDLDATEKTVEQLKTSLGHEPSEDEVKAEKARAEKDKALLNSAVTVADLQKTLQSPLFFEGDSADGVANENDSDKNTFARKLSQKTKIVGGVDLGLKENATADERQKAIADKLTDGNIGVISDGTNTLTIKLAKNLVNLTSVETGSGNNKTKMTENGITTTVKDGDTFKVTTTTPNGLATTEVKLDSDDKPTGESTTTMVTTDGVTITTQTPKNGDKPASTTETKLSKDGLATDGTVKVTNGKTGDDAKDLVTIGKGTETDQNATDKEFGTVTIDGKNGSNATLTVDRGTSSLDDTKNIGTDPNQDISENNPAKMDRITYTTKNKDGKDVTHEVATMDDGFFLTTSKDVADGKAAAGVKLNHTIKFTDGANTKVSTVDSEKGIHELHVDVTGLPMTYTVSQTGGTDAPVSVSKVGDTYQLADGTKLVKVGNKFYKPSQLVNPNADQPQVKSEEVAKNWTVNDSISLVNKDGSNNAPTTLKNVGSGLKDANGNATTLDQAVGSNAVNVDDLRTMGKAATTEVTGTGAAEVTKVTGANGQNIYNVHVERFMQVAETDVEGNKVVKAADNHYYKEADIKNKTYIDGKWYNNTDIKDKTYIDGKWYSDTEITDGKANPDATELTVQATTAPNKAVGLQNNLVNPNDNTPTRLSNLASALSGEVGNGANTEDNSAINGIDKNGKPTSESGNNTFVKNVLDLDATVKTEEQLKTSLGHDPSEDEVKAEKARAEKDKALLNSAVTVADLQKTLQSPLFFEGDSADGVANENGSDKNTFARKLSQKTKIVGGVDLGLKENATADERKKAIAEKLTDHNIGVISNGTDTLTIKLAKDLTDLHSVTTTDDKGNTTQINGKGLATTADNGKGNIKITTVTSDGITIVTTDKDGNNSVSLTNKGLDNGHHQIINVKSGLLDRQGNPVTLKNAPEDILNNAVNVKDLRDVVQGLTDSGKGGGFGLTGNNGEVHKSLGETITLKGGIANKLENGIDMNKPEKATTDKNTYIDVKTSKNGSEKIMVVEIAKDLTDLNSAEFTDQEGNTTKMKGDGIYIDKNGDGNADISLTSEGLNNGGNKITNVADGTEDTDAVNVSQLNKLKQEIKQNIGDEINELNAYAPVIYSDKDGNRVIRKGNKFVKKNDETVEILPQDIRLSLVNADGKTTNPSTLQNVAKGVQDTDAVNVKQLKEATEKPLTFNGDAGSSSAKLGETVAIKGGANSADLTDNNIGVIADSSTKTLNVKLSKKLKGLESAEFVDNNGNTTNITGDGVHISGGNGSNVSLTSQGLNNGGNRITNVAPGVEATDAVNVSQLNQVGAALHNRINNVAKGAYGGVASAGAMASLPQAYLPGKSMVAAGASHYRGESAVALGASRISDNGKIILKLNASHNTSGNTMVGAGVGYQF
ncbi:YadA-like family protein [Gallibacterium anatis]|uniref:YadA-like family protein n=1 Tax=Gallibacterium anatis TaxID=750 RepID=UPI0039FDA2EF